MSLIESAKENDLQAVKTLIAGGADVNAVDEDGRTALWHAARKGHVECATALIDAKAEVNKADVDGVTPLHMASFNGCVECVRLLLQHEANVSALTKYGNSPLHYASLGGRLACVKMLIAAGAERDRPNNGGYTPLANAITYSRPDVAEFLFHSGAKVTNLPPAVKVPAWMTDIIAQRRNAMASLRVLKGVRRRRFKVPGPATSHIANRIPLDIVNLLGLYVWNTRLHPSWGGSGFLDGQEVKK